MEANRRFLTRSPFLRCAGRIPESIGNLTSLQRLQLRFNQLEGQCTCIVCLSRSTLRALRCDRARTGPSLDETLRMLKPLTPTLECLDLRGNQLRGTITDDIAAFTKLSYLDLQGMDLKGTFVV